MGGDWGAGYECARATARAQGLSFWIYAGMLYVQDGGKRGLEGGDWEPAGSASARAASEEEKEMWTALTSLESD